MRINLFGNSAVATTAQLEPKGLLVGALNGWMSRPLAAREIAAARRALDSAQFWTAPTADCQLVGWDGVQSWNEVEVAVKVALAAMSAVTHIGDRDRFVLYSDLILDALSEAARKALQMIPEGYQFQSPIIRESIEKGILQGRAEGHAEGRAEGHAEGHAEGRAFEKAVSVLEVFEARAIPVSLDQRSRILACTDLEQLSHWHKRSITAASVEELFTQ